MREPGWGKPSARRRRVAEPATAATAANTIPSTRSLAASRMTASHGRAGAAPAVADRAGVLVVVIAPPTGGPPPPPPSPASPRRPARSPPGHRAGGRSAPPPAPPPAPL